MQASDPGPEPTSQSRLRDLEAEVATLKAEIERRDQETADRRQARIAIASSTSRVVLRALTGSQLYQNTQRAWDAWHSWAVAPGKTSWPEAATRDLAASLLARLTRVGMLAVLAVLLPSTLALCQIAILCRQNEIVDRQNTLIEKQNDLATRQTQFMEEQNHLAEASRRAAVMFELANIVNDIRVETPKPNAETSKDPLAPTPRSRVALSDQLVNRIVALSRALRPYRYFEYVDGPTGESQARLRPKPVSPERGQLLIALVESNVDMTKIAVRRSTESIFARRTSPRPTSIKAISATPISEALISRNPASTRSSLAAPSVVQHSPARVRSSRLTSRRRRSTTTGSSGTPSSLASGRRSAIRTTVGCCCD